ncbi:MAG: phenylalanine--tRNA ligase subunit alpha [Nitrososphaerota archaeon]
MPLHRLEKKVLKALREGEGSIEDLARRAKISTDQVRRAVEWLSSKGLVEVKREAKKWIELGEEGKKVVEKGFPERRLVEALERLGPLSVDELAREVGSAQELTAALGRAKSKGWVRIVQSQDGTLLELAFPPKETEEESIVKRLSLSPLAYDELNDDEKRVVEELAKRPGYIVVKVLKSSRVRLTEEGIKASQAVKEIREVDQLTPELILSGRWRRVKLRGLDVRAPAPTLYPGKKHPVQRFIDEVREIFVSLGFEEVEGPLIQPCFWNFDALFTPQDHPAREMQDTFYIEGVRAKRVAEAELIQRVLKAHEDGGDTGSKGWGYKWSLEKSEMVVLRTHTTAVTIKYLADHRPSEARVFSVGRVFRNEKVTFKNLTEFHQIEGIAVARNVTLRDMMGLLSTFYERLGLKKVKFWPSYFPYTEPSLQSVVYHEKLGRWVELCGMGIFRPEVTLPLGVENPVLAWGGGLERLVMLRYGIDDVRLLYENDLGWLRRVLMCQ